MLERVSETPAGTVSAPAGEPFLRIRNLVKNFGSFTALNDVSLDIYKGELVCFLGPSGCGKTTLLRAIAGLDVQTAGTIEIGGRDVSRLAPSERDFGIVFQSYALFPNLTIARNVGYGLVNLRQSRADIAKRVAELLALVGLHDQGTKYPVQLSGGQQQRVALARALATSPSILLLDEPLSALDARVRVRLRDEIRTLQRRLGVTTIMVTHDQEEALTMADRIIVMNHGVIEQVGTPMDIYRDPQTAFVADFIGTMTFISAEVAGPGQVRIGEIVLTANGLEGVAAGSEVRLGFRPEDVRVRDLAADAINRFDTRIERLSFLGSFCRAVLRPQGGGGSTMIADFSANLMRDRGLAEGQILPVALPPESIHFYVVPAARAQ
ncbi:MAG: putative 2-aminoethylphosphonate ABC transporter ATP-binding protein [Hyphomicrobiaceae bacterium]|nr:MAG: putative 2-aminoethylphosphonate ABC transporter ATP-binding protein [Hyphomicrobiaceae bacterium]